MATKRKTIARRAQRSVDAWLEERGQALGYVDYTSLLLRVNAAIRSALAADRRARGKRKG